MNARGGNLLWNAVPGLADPSAALSNVPHLDFNLHAVHLLGVVGHKASTAADWNRERARREHWTVRLQFGQLESGRLRLKARIDRQVIANHINRGMAHPRVVEINVGSALDLREGQARDSKAALADLANVARDGRRAWTRGTRLPKEQRAIGAGRKGVNLGGDRVGLSGHIAPAAYIDRGCSTGSQWREWIGGRGIEPRIQNAARGERDVQAGDGLCDQPASSTYEKTNGCDEILHTNHLFSVRGANKLARSIVSIASTVYYADLWAGVNRIHLLTADTHYHA